MAKAKKARSGKYEEKLAVQNITFDELIQLSANYTPPKKEKAKKPAKKAVKKKK
jgi:DNA-binding protein H-NS